MDEIKILASTNPNFLENTLTQDLTTLDVIYDLIDNSIDAARREIFSKDECHTDEFGMPISYEGYEIKLIVSNEKISISDNCSGFGESELTSRAFIIGEPSRHDYGIGQYGVGLKRALLKIGNKYSLVTSNLNNTFIINFDNKNLTTNNEFTAFKKKRTKEDVGTIFTIEDLKKEILPDIESEIWSQNAIEGLKQRYQIYLKKGLTLSVTYFKEPTVYIPKSLVNIRSNSKFEPIKKEYKLENGVKVIITAGIHEKYLFPSEDGYSLANNRKLTNDYGIYFICNDRVIVSHSTEDVHGWKTKWHSEYNGFICYVRFVSKDPSLLPINTAKTALRVDSSTFLEAISKIQPIAESYRKNIKKRYLRTNKKINLDSSLERHTEESSNTTKTPSNFDNKSNASTKHSNTNLTNTINQTKNIKPLNNTNLYRIPAEQGINLALENKDIRKLIDLYKSICTLSLTQHGSLVVIGIAVFYESLASYLGKDEATDISSYYSSNTIKAKTANDYSKTDLKNIHESIKYIHKESNLIKHTKNYRMETALQLIPYMEILERVTADLINNIPE